MASANDTLIANLESQLERLVEQLKDLEECKSDLPEDEFDLMREETVEQIREFGETLDRMQKGDLTVDNKLSKMKAAIRNAISSSFHTEEMIKLFGAQGANDLEVRLMQLEEDFKLKKVEPNAYDRQKLSILTDLQGQNRKLSQEQKAFLVKMRDLDMDHLEQFSNCRYYSTYSIMFRMPPQVDPAEERRKLRESVKSNIITFVVLCAAIRLAPFLLEKAGLE